MHIVKIFSVISKVLRLKTKRPSESVYPVHDYLPTCQPTCLVILMKVVPNSSERQAAQQLTMFRYKYIPEIKLITTKLSAWAVFQSEPIIFRAHRNLHCFDMNNM